MRTSRLIVLLVAIVALGALMVFLLREDATVTPSRYVEPDRLFEAVESNVRGHADFEVIAEIDHSRLAAEAGSTMPPSRVLIWSDPELEASILKHNPVAAIDLPLRVLAYEDQHSRKPAVIVNSYDYVAQRYELPDDAVIRTRYQDAIATALKGIPDEAIDGFPSDSIPDSGLITLDSPYDFAVTEERILESIAAQSDTVIFGSVDFARRSKEHGVTLQPTRLILFGGPGPGGRAMASAPTLGLDAFCQKLLIWQDASGTVHVTWNDLSALAERQQVSGGLALKVINRRLNETFSAALLK